MVDKMGGRTVSVWRKQTSVSHDSGRQNCSSHPERSGFMGQRVENQEEVEEFRAVRLHCGGVFVLDPCVLY